MKINKYGPYIVYILYKDPWFLIGISGLGVRLHVGPEQGVDAGLVAFALGLEPVQHLLVQADADAGLGLGQHDHGFLKKGLVQFGNVGVVDLLILHLPEALRVRIIFFLHKPFSLSGSLYAWK